MEKVDTHTYRTSLEDTTLGPLELSQGTAYARKGEDPTITYKKATFAGETFHVDFQKGKASLYGGMKADRKIVGTVSTPNNTIEMFGVELRNAQIVINEEQQKVMLQGQFTEFDLTFIGLFIGNIGSKSIMFDAALQQPPETYYPFREISTDAPDFLKEISMSNIKVGVRAGLDLSAKEQKGEDKQRVSGDIYIAGDMTNLPLIDRKLSGRIEIGYGGKQPQVTLIVELPEGWKLSDLAPDKITGGLRDAVNAVQLNDVTMLATTQSMYPYNDINFEQGLSLYAAMQLPEKGTNKTTDIIRNIHNDLGIPIAQMDLYGNINPKARSFSLATIQQFENLSFTIGNFTFDDAALGYRMSVAAKKATFGLRGQCDMTPPKQNEALTFNAGFEIETGAPIQIGGYLSMRDTWTNPLGIQGISVGNLGMSGMQDLGQIASTAGLGALIPAEAGMTGEASIEFSEDAQSSGTFSIQAGTDATEWAFDAQIQDAPNLPDIASFILRQLNTDVTIPTKRIVPITVNNARLQFVPLGTNIGSIRIQQGIGFELDIEALGHNGKLDMGASFADTGIVCKGHLDPVHIGALHVVGVEGEEKPFFDYQLNLKNQHAILKGNLFIGDEDSPVIQSRTNMELSKDGANFIFDTELGPFSACVHGETDKIQDKPSDFTLTVDLQNDLLQEIQKLSQAIGEASKERIEIEGADVSEVSASISLDKLNAEKLNEAQKEYKKKLEALNKVWSDKKHETQEEIQSLEEEIASKQKAVDKVWGGGIIGREATQEEIEEFKQKKQQKQKELEEIKKRHTIEKINTFDDVFGEIIAFGEKVGEDVAQLSLDAISKILEGFSVERLYFSGSTRELAQGDAPTVALTINLGGTKKCSEFTFDFNNPEHSMKEIAIGVINLIAGDRNVGTLCTNPPRNVCDITK